MTVNNQYDVAIIGGGLAGLALSIQCARAGYVTVLFEKEIYPFHKVCGEYISMECWNFLEKLGLPLNEMNLPLIRRLLITAPNGKKIEQKLPLGGFGISRYTIDNELYKLAKSAGVVVVDGVKVDEVKFRNDMFTMHTAAGTITCKVAAGCFGKRSNLDVKWKRGFILKKDNRLNNYIGVKYHIKTAWPDDLIALHNFENGYCGISKIEDGKYCLCYLTTAKNLKRSGNSVEVLERKFLHENSHLRQIFLNAEKIMTSPLTIAQISFDGKKQVENHVLMTGDAAGMITPLCGNGMSMALHGSKMTFQLINQFLQKKISRHQMEDFYRLEWKEMFSRRLRTGKFIQKLFGKKWMTNLFITCVKPFPKFVSYLIRQTHGQPF